MAIVRCTFPTEGHVVAVKREQSMIGDGDAMRVTAEITHVAQHLGIL